jgi:O-antigen ligase
MEKLDREVCRVIMKLKFSTKEIVIFIIIALFLLPYVGMSDFRYIQDWSWLSDFSIIVSRLRLINLIIAFSIVFLIGMRDGIKVTKGCIVCILPYVYLTLRTFFAGGTKENINLLVFIMMIVLADMFVLKNADIFYRLIDFMDFCTIINFIFIIKYVGQGGLVYYSRFQNRYWNGYYLLGYDNGFIILMLFLIILNLVIHHYTGKRRYLLMAVLQVVSELLVFSACSLLILAVFGMLAFILGKLNNVGKIVRQPAFVVIAYLMLFWLLVIVKIQNYINTVLNRFFGKTIESTRLNLWNDGLKVVKEYFLFGTGYKIKTFWNGYATPHNSVLECLAYGGIVLLILFVIIFIYSFCQLDKYIKFYEAKLIYCGIIAFMTGYIAEGYGTYISFWAFLVLLLFGANIQRLHVLLQDGYSNYED